jgi:hypothetical protein
MPCVVHRLHMQQHKLVAAARQQRRCCGGLGSKVAVIGPRGAGGIVAVHVKGHPQACVVKHTVKQTVKSMVKHTMEERAIEMVRQQPSHRDGQTADDTRNRTATNGCMRGCYSNGPAFCTRPSCIPPRSRRRAVIGGPVHPHYACLLLSLCCLSMPPPPFSACTALRRSPPAPSITCQSLPLFPHLQ